MEMPQWCLASATGHASGQR